MSPGNVLWVLLRDEEPLTALDQRLQSLEMPGLVVRGSSDRPLIGKWKSSEMESATEVCDGSTGQVSQFLVRVHIQCCTKSMLKNMDRSATEMASAVSTCVHCGFCLAACPTYQELGQEADSPRGRIVLMKEVLEGKLPLETALPHIDPCLGCLACEPACPSGVPYRDLISPFRAHD